MHTKEKKKIVKSKHEWLLLPNILTYVRYLLIPLFVWLYMFKEKYTFAALVMVISGLTDIADGYIARHFNMVSDFGKALDPLADKLTQSALLVCLLSKYKLMWGLIFIFAVCEIAKLTLGIIIAKRCDEVNSARWYGKVNTVVIYLSMMLLIMFPQMNISLANMLMLLCCGVMIAAHALYFVFLGKILHKNREK